MSALPHRLPLATARASDSTLEVKLLIHACVCTTVVHNTARNYSDSLSCSSPHDHHCLDDIYCRAGGRGWRTVSNADTLGVSRNNAK